MSNNLQPKILIDKSRLQEIYDLRVMAYEQSSFNDVINFNLYPKGWSDFLDDSSYHWIIEVENKIVASARLSIIKDFSDIIKLGNEISEIVLPAERPFMFFSRLVILDNYRGLGLSRQLDQARILHFYNTNSSFAIACCRQDRLNSLLQQKFETIADYTDRQNFKVEQLKLLILKQPRNDI